MVSVSLLSWPEKAMAAHSSTLAYKIPWMEEPGRLQSMGSRRVGHDWASDFTFTFHFHALDKAMATHSSVLAWRIPGTAEPGGLPSMGLHRVGHNWSDLAAAAAAATQLTTQWYLLSTFCVKGLYYSCNTKISTQRRWLNLKLQKVRECFLASFRGDISCLSEIFKDLQVALDSEWLLYRFVISLQMLRCFVKRTNTCN